MKPMTESAPGYGCCSAEKLTDEISARAREYAEESLQWMITDALAQEIDVKTYRDNGRLDMTIDVVRPGDAKTLQARFQNLWDVQ